MLTKNWMESRYTIGSLVARSAAMQRLVKHAGHQINTDAPLLVVGETGTGKSLLARCVHNSSTRVAKPFVSVAAERLTPNVTDSTLLGTPSEKGLFARAEGGTLLLTGIEHLSPMAQERLNKTLADGHIYRWYR
jgi:DNA-binding NtrC family response regulator